MKDIWNKIVLLFSYDKEWMLFLATASAIMFPATGEGYWLVNSSIWCASIVIYSKIENKDANS